MQTKNDGMIRRLDPCVNPTTRAVKRNFKTFVHGIKPKTSSVPLVASIGGISRTVGSVESIGVEGSLLVGQLRFNSDAHGNAIREKYSFGDKQPKVIMHGAAAIIQF